MASTFNLVRNSRVWFTGAVNASTGAINTGAVITDTGTAATTELTVLDGFSFSQSTQQQTIQISEAGTTPVRGQRAFNTTLDPVEFSFSTYIKPQGLASSTAGITAEESVLWNALFSSTGIDPATATQGVACTVTSITRTATNAASATIVCTAVNLGTIGVAAVGDIFNLTGLAATVTNAQEWTGPVKLVATPTGGYSAATSISVEYLKAPNVATTTPVGVVGTIRLTANAWNYQGTSVTSPAYSFITTGLSNKNQLQKFGMFFLVDNALYGIDNCVLDSASIDFGLDGIATVVWSGKGTALNYLSGTTVSSAAAGVFGGTHIGTAKAKQPGNYITNKLSTMGLVSKIGGTDTSAGTTYTVALTGGNITIANNVSYVVPSNIGVVNQPIGYFTGTRSVSGNVTAYLRTGSGNTASLLTAVLAGGAETKYKVQIEMGGAANNPHVDLNLPGCVLQVPTVETADVMSTTINFSAQGFEPAYYASVANNVYDIEKANEMTVYYYSNNTAV
jgi:hypothetical protein